MRWLVLCIAFSASTAAADTTYGVGVETVFVDLHAQPAGEIGIASRVTFGRRVQLLGELSLGEMLSDGPLGLAVDARIGARVRAITFEHDAELLFDAGAGLERMWSHDGPTVGRGYGFVGWGTRIRAHTRAYELTLRILASPTLDDPEALRVLCRGTCPPPSDLPPLDLGVAVQGNVVWW